jgi:hypothetical protein
MPGQYNTLSYDVLRVACTLMCWYGVETIPIKFKKNAWSSQNPDIQFMFSTILKQTKCQEILHYWQ